MPMSRSSNGRAVSVSHQPVFPAPGLPGPVAGLSRAGRKNLIHHKTASRTKSRLAKAVLAKPVAAKK